MSLMSLMSLVFTLSVVSGERNLLYAVIKSENIYGTPCQTPSSEVNTAPQNPTRKIHFPVSPMMVCRRVDISSRILVPVVISGETSEAITKTAPANNPVNRYAIPRSNFDFLNSAFVVQPFSLIQYP